MTLTQIWNRMCVYGLIVATAVVSPVFGQKSFKVLDRWKIGGEGGWDYLCADSKTNRIYITHGPRVEVLDRRSGKPIGAITGLKGTHGVALDDVGRYGYISDGGANAVVVFDRSTLQVMSSIPAGTNPDGIVFEPRTKTVWAFNGRSKDVTVIDTVTQRAITTVPLPGKPEFPVADGKGNIFDNIEDKNEIVRLDAKHSRVTGIWPISPCESPSGLAIDRKGRRLFAVCDGKKMAVVDEVSGKVIASPAIGEGPDAAAYDSKNKLAFSSNGEGTLTIVDASDSSYRVLQNLTTQPGARTMTLDPSTGLIYLVSAEFGSRPPATENNPRPRPVIELDTFTVIMVGRE